jgi:hypothetical protein
VSDPTHEIRAEYERRLQARRRRVAAHDRGHLHFGTARLATAGAGIAILVVLGLDGIVWLVVPLAVFAVLAVLHARLLNARDRAQSAVSFYERGLARIGDEWVGRGRSGDEYRQPDHVYADDLDIFGRGSLFELLATTRTQAGEETLARWLLGPAAPDLIRARQQAVGELASATDLREAVAIQGDTLRVGVHAPLLRRWAGSPLRLRGAATRIALLVLVVITLSALLWWTRFGTFGWVLLVAMAAQSGVAALFKNRVLAVIEAVEEPAHDLDLLASLLRTLEQASFQSPHLQALQARVRTGGETASAAIARLSRLVALLASRRNVMFAIPAAFLMWATQWAFAIEAWRARTGREVERWLDTVGEFEALLAMAGFAAEHPSFVMARIVDGSPHVHGRAVAHPTLPPSAVPNDVLVGGEAPHLLIVSGSNMSGKSTLLRALGVNVVLAQMGAPVRAAAFTLSPLAIGADIRVLDSLTDGRSRFFAEITRLKHIVDLAERQNGAVLFLLDEILSGTNSHDRRVGAEALLEGLVRLGAVGLVTTHDLALAEIAGRLPRLAENSHFEDRFESGRLTFDYTLKPGLVRTSNALALMRSIGLDV